MGARKSIEDKYEQAILSTRDLPLCLRCKNILRPTYAFNRMLEDTVVLPVILHEDLSSFHATHFSPTTAGYFSEHFLGPVHNTGDEGDEEIEEDDLGYYHDGVKRTLTDEQIAIFRHSEIEALLRKRRQQEEENEAASDAESVGSVPAERLEDGELEDAPLKAQEDDTPEPPKSASAEKPQKLSKKERRKLYAKQKGLANPRVTQQYVKPDLRKRTWDQVDAGMDSLVYDDDSSSASMAVKAPQRRRISYGDD